MKSENAFRSISEVSELLKVPAHVLRFWETQFSEIKPVKRVGGRRYYRPEDVQLLQQIKDYHYKEGYTIKGVQKLLRSSNKDKTSVIETKEEKTKVFIQEMEDVKKFLSDFI